MDGFFGLLCEGVHRFEGTVNQFTGDGVMALFGAPIAHPDTLSVNVYQLSTTYGRGMPAEATLFFPLPVEV